MGGLARAQNTGKGIHASKIGQKSPKCHFLVRFERKILKTAKKFGCQAPEEKIKLLGGRWTQGRGTPLSKTYGQLSHNWLHCPAHAATGVGSRGPPAVSQTTTVRQPVAASAGRARLTSWLDGSGCSPIGSGCAGVGYPQACPQACISHIQPEAVGRAGRTPCRLAAGVGETW